MPWTDELIVAEFRTHLAYWQTKLRLADIDIDVKVVNSLPGNQWCAVSRRNGGENRHGALVEIRRGWYSDSTRYDVWETCAHELVHVMNWAMALVFDPLQRQYTPEQLHLAQTLLDAGNEELAYKWEAILAKWFEADAPPKEMP